MPAKPMTDDARQEDFENATVHARERIEPIMRAEIDRWCALSLVPTDGVPVLRAFLQLAGRMVAERAPPDLTTKHMCELAGADFGLGVAEVRTSKPPERGLLQ